MTDQEVIQELIEDNARLREVVKSLKAKLKYEVEVVRPNMINTSFTHRISTPIQFALDNIRDIICNYDEKEKTRLERHVFQIQGIIWREVPKPRSMPFNH